LADRDPPVIVTAARGSSDHASGYFKYLSEIIGGVPVASIGPSVASIYRAPLKLRGAVVISVSQSGRSPDIVELQATAKAAGAYALAIVNDPTSPLANSADAVLPLHAGPEKSVAATKSFLSSAAVLAALSGLWFGDDALFAAARNLPEAFTRALDADWDAARPALIAAQSAYVVGRGPALPIAAESALKLKETAMLHAEAFSGAEVMHGPLQLVDNAFPVILYRPRDAAFTAMGEAATRLTAVGGEVFVAEADGRGDHHLPYSATGHPLLDPLALLVSFYGLAETVARARGHDPDRPVRLKKVTETV
jgi:glucosamine--fructose-6-phosphate aminotransferase (isomerizing)